MGKTFNKKLILGTVIAAVFIIGIFTMDLAYANHPPQAGYRLTQFIQDLASHIPVTSADIVDGTITGVDVTPGIALTGDVSIDSPTFQVDSANDRVGIGTATPTSKLHVVGDLTLQSDIICAGCIDSTDIQDGAITGSKIDGTSKLLFRVCSVTFTNVAPMTFQGSSCLLPGLASGDNVIITNTDMGQNCFIFGGLSSSLDNILQLKAYNGCPNTVTQTVDFSMIIFRVN